MNIEKRLEIYLEIKESLLRDMLYADFSTKIIFGFCYRLNKALNKRHIENCDAYYSFDMRDYFPELYALRVKPFWNEGIFGVNDINDRLIALNEVIETMSKQLNY